jgi:hypothetical protein
VMRSRNWLSAPFELTVFASLLRKLAISPLTLDQYAHLFFDRWSVIASLIHFGTRCGPWLEASQHRCGNVLENAAIRIDLAYQTQALKPGR